MYFSKNCFYHINGKPIQITPIIPRVRDTGDASLTKAVSFLKTLPLHLFLHCASNHQGKSGENVKCHLESKVKHYIRGSTFLQIFDCQSTSDDTWTQTERFPTVHVISVIIIITYYIFYIHIILLYILIYDIYINMYIL